MSRVERLVNRVADKIGDGDVNSYADPTRGAFEIFAPVSFIDQLLRERDLGEALLGSELYRLPQSEGDVGLN